MNSKLKINYRCPHCDAYLRVWKNVIFSVRSSKGGKKSILLLNPELGNYTITSHPELSFEKGEAVDFFCPVCQANLSDSSINDKLVRVIMSDENGNEFDVYFSRIAGEHSTFKISKNNVIERFGKDVSSYVNYFMKRYQQHKKNL